MNLLARLLADSGKSLGVVINVKGSDSMTPLLWALKMEHEAVVKMLLDTGKVEVDSRDKHGQMPLSLAAEKGEEAVVQILLETGKVEIDSKGIKTVEHLFLRFGMSLRS